MKVKNRARARERLRARYSRRLELTLIINDKFLKSHKRVPLLSGRGKNDSSNKYGTFSPPPVKGEGISGIFEPSYNDVVS